MNFWTRLGIVVAALAFFCFCATQLFAQHPEFFQYQKVIAASLAGAGTLLWLVGKALGNNVDTTAKTAPIFTCAYCGIILALCGGALDKLTLISEYVSAPAIVQTVGSFGKSWPQFFRPGSHTGARRRNDPKGPLRIQGIFYRERGASAIINGQSVSVGDHVGTAKIVAIERQSVTVEIADQRKVLTLL